MGEKNDSYTGLCTIIDQVNESNFKIFEPYMPHFLFAFAGFNKPNQQILLMLQNSAQRIKMWNELKWKQVITGYTPKLQHSLSKYYKN